MAREDLARGSCGNNCIGLKTLERARITRNPDPPTLYQVRESSNDEPSPAVSFILRCRGRVLGSQSTGRYCSLLSRPKPNPYFLQSAAGRKSKMKAKCPYFDLAGPIAQLPATRSFNCEHTTLRAVKQSHQQVHADTNRFSRRDAIDPTLLHARAQLASQG